MKSRECLSLISIFFLVTAFPESAITGYRPMKASDVAAYVQANAGVGKVN